MSELSEAAETFPLASFLESHMDIANPNGIPDMLKAWELDPHFRGLERAIPLLDYGDDQTVSSGFSRLHDSMWHFMVVEDAAKPSMKSYEDPKVHIGCPFRPKNLNKTHLKLRLADSTDIESLVQMINLCLDSFSEYDFSYIEAGTLWKGKYIQGSRSCVLHIHLYCDISGDHGCYIIEAKRVAGEAKPFHDFWKDFKAMLTSIGGGSVISSSSSSQLHTAASEDFFYTEMGMPDSSHPSPVRDHAQTSSIFRHSPPPPPHSNGTMYSLPHPDTVSSFISVPSSSSVHSAAQEQHPPSRPYSTVLRADSFLLGRPPSSFGDAPSAYFEHLGGTLSQSQSHQLLLQQQLYIPPPSSRQSPRAFLQAIEPILRMAESPYYEVKLEAARMLCDISCHDELLLGEPECVARICRTLEQLIHHGGFKAVKEQAIVTLARFVEIPGYDRHLVHSDALPVLISYVCNPDDPETSFETAQLRRECARILAALVVCDANSVLRKLQLSSVHHHSQPAGASVSSGATVAGTSRMDPAAFLHSYALGHDASASASASVSAGSSAQGSKSAAAGYTTLSKQHQPFQLKHWLSSVEGIRDVRTRLHAVKIRDALLRALQK